MKHLFDPTNGCYTGEASTFAAKFEQAIGLVIQEAVAAGFHHRDVELLAYHAVGMKGCMIAMEVRDAAHKAEKEKKNDSSQK